MKLFIAGLATESNTFSPIPTGRTSFEECMVAHGDATQQPANIYSAPMHVWRRRAEENHMELVESLAAFAQPAGVTVGEVYEAYRDEILSDLTAAMPVDIALFSMHGAMIATGYDDCEGDLMDRARDIVGPDVVIGLEIDPHNHLTELMMTRADLIICYKEYPHTDMAERADELFALALGAANSEIKPVMRDYDCRMISVFHTPVEPVRGFVDSMMAREGKDGILSLSLTHGFPWADHVRVGARTLAITDGDAGLAQNTARQLGEELWELRDALRIRYPGIPEALDIAQAADTGPVVLADTADNAGGGAPSDATFVLEEVLKRGLRDIALGIFWDPVVVRMCMETGTGTQMPIRLGGKVGPMSGDPIDITVTIRNIATDHVHHLGNAAMPLGNMLWLESNGIHLLVNDNRTQMYHPEAFSDMGIDIAGMKIVVVKSSQHFYTGFKTVAAEIIHVATPGAITPDFKSIPYTVRDQAYWPNVENPFA